MICKASTSWHLPQVSNTYNTERHLKPNSVWKSLCPLESTTQTFFRATRLIIYQVCQATFFFPGDICSQIKSQYLSSTSTDSLLLFSQQNLQLTYSWTLGRYLRRVLGRVRPLIKQPKSPIFSYQDRYFIAPHYLVNCH